MKKCIWCCKTEISTNFSKIAHTFPKSLGGKHICENVCDECNEYFGKKEFGLPGVEIAFKEVLNSSKYILLSQHKEIKLKRFKSEYFVFDYKTNNRRTFKFKMSYKLRKNFQQEFARRFRRGMYKVFLEERERLIGDAQDDRFNFIREFSRYNLNDYPIYIQLPKFKAVFYNTNDIITPEIRFTEYSSEIDNKFRFYTYPLIGHSFVIPTSNQFMEDRLKSFKQHLIKTNDAMGTELLEITKIEDLDFRFEYMNDEK